MFKNWNQLQRFQRHPDPPRTAWSTALRFVHWLLRSLANPRWNPYCRNIEKIGEDDVPICSHIVICWYNNVICCYQSSSFHVFWMELWNSYVQNPAILEMSKTFNFLHPPRTHGSWTFNNSDFWNPECLGHPRKPWFSAECLGVCVCIYIYILILYKLHAYLPLHSNPFRYTILHPKALYPTVFHYMMSVYIYIYIYVCMFAVNATDTTCSEISLRF